MFETKNDTTKFDGISHLFHLFDADREEWLMKDAVKAVESGTTGVDLFLAGSHREKEQIKQMTIKVDERMLANLQAFINAAKEDISAGKPGHIQVRYRHPSSYTNPKSPKYSVNYYTEERLNAKRTTGENYSST